jgi:hypothetical protein
MRELDISPRISGSKYHPRPLARKLVLTPLKKTFRFSLQRSVRTLLLPT